jgi:hypothetical protein
MEISPKPKQIISYSGKQGYPPFMRKQLQQLLNAYLKHFNVGQIFKV